MALTKKQVEQIEKNYKNYWHGYKITEDESLKTCFQTTLFAYQDIMSITGYNMDDFTRLKNESLYEHDFHLYFMYSELNDMIDKIEDKHITFLYDLKNIDNLIDNYDYTIQYSTLKDKVYYIRKQVEEDNRIKKQLELKIKNMIA